MQSITGSRQRAPRSNLRTLVVLCGTAALLSLSLGQAWLVPLPFQHAHSGDDGIQSMDMEKTHMARRVALGGLATGMWGMQSGVQPVFASGGATAGKYSTIPSAKRRFYGRVRQGIYQFLQMEPAVMKGDLKDPLITEFFAKTIIKVVGGIKEKGCDWNECISKEKRTSRWNDFKAASDLLASAFRYDASDVNDYLPQVRIIRAMHKKVAKIQKAIEAGDVATVQQLYKNCKMDLNKYTPMVELAQLDSPDYTHEWDTRPEVWCQGSFCV